MTTKAGLRPNHYEVLGLTRDATGAEIEQAFRRKLSAFTPGAFGSVAETSVAYETLRDIAKRRAYDEAIGLAERRSAGEHSPFQWNGRPWSMVARQVVVEKPRAASAPSPTVAAGPSPARAVAPPISARPVAAPARRPVAAPKAERPRRAAEILPMDGIEASPLHGQRALLIAAAAIGTVGLIGGWVGWASANDDSGQQQKALVTKLPQATARPADVIDVEPSAAAAMPSMLADRRPGRVAPRRAIKDRTAPDIAPGSSEQALPQQSGEPAPTLALAENEAPTPESAVAAAMPLSNRTVARTIDRIGYSCGAVESTAGGGAPGVFTVNCTSGQSYRATPVRGRYHFRRVAKP